MSRIVEIWNIHEGTIADLVVWEGNAEQLKKAAGVRRGDQTEGDVANVDGLAHVNPPRAITVAMAKRQLIKVLAKQRKIMHSWSETSTHEEK
jgi:hypothetical protein